MWIRRALVVLSLALTPAPAFAAAISVAPLLFELSPAAPIAAAEVNNPSDEPVTVQLRLFRWTVVGSEDRYEPTEELAASPRIFELPPGGKQIVRIGALTPAAVEGEAAFRLFVDQLPRPGVNGVQMPIRLVMPVFRRGDNARPQRSRAALTWRAVSKTQGEVELTALNAGARRVKLMEMFEVGGDGARRPIAPGLSGYVLAGGERRWSYKTPSSANEIRLSVSDEDGVLSVTVPIER